jgi:hypothetical protein
MDRDGPRAFTHWALIGGAFKVDRNRAAKPRTLIEKG